jgi:hypothetical protein
VGLFSNQQVEYMEESIVTNYSAGSRSESRTILDKYFSVQFSLNGMGPTYLFKLRDISLNGICILVKEDSAVLKHLKVGDILNMEYNPPKSSGSNKIFKTRIEYISKNHQNCFTGHFLVGLSIIDK